MLIAGLGNPGSSYAATRHNAGFILIDRLSEKLRATDVRNARRYLLRKANYRGLQLFLLLPMMYMNRSGIPIAEVALEYGLSAGELLIAYDDFQLPLGRIRLRKTGTDGGHNGMASIIGELGTEDIPRLRLGIFTETEFEKYETPADFVLSPFTPGEIPAVHTMAERGIDAILTTLTEGIDKAMTIFNKANDKPENPEIDKE